MKLLHSFALLALGFTAATASADRGSIHLSPIGTIAHGGFAESAAEIVSYDPATRRLFVVNAQAATVDVVDIQNPAAPQIIFAIDVKPYGAVANSVAVRSGLIAVAVEADPKTNPGRVVFFDATGQFLSSVQVGAQPDMLTFTPNGRYLLTANEGEPAEDYSVDPEGSVSIIDVSGNVAQLDQAHVRTATFTAYNGLTREQLFADGAIRVFGPAGTNAQNFEPEYITVSHDSKTAWVSLQEANALAVVDLRSASITDLIGLGTKNYNAPGNGMDASDRDNQINIANWPVQGFYQPDAIASYRVRGQTYLVTANEGDARDWAGYSEERRLGASTYRLDPAAFPNAATLKQNANLGRLNVTTAHGDTDNDGDFDVIYTFGGRSFSIWNEQGGLVFDSGDQFEQITAAQVPAFFNASHSDNAFDSRSDNKGPEPEGLAIGKVFGRDYAFIGLERIGGVMVYDISDPQMPRFVQWANNRDFTQPVNTAAAGDLGPEGLLFIKSEDSPTGQPLLVVANEISGTTTIYQIAKTN